MCADGHSIAGAIVAGSVTQVFCEGKKRKATSRVPDALPSSFAHPAKLRFGGGKQTSQYYPSHTAASASAAGSAWTTRILRLTLQAP